MEFLEMAGKKKKEEFLFFIPKRKLTETSGLITQMWLSDI